VVNLVQLDKKSLSDLRDTFSILRVKLVANVQLLRIVNVSEHSVLPCTHLFLVAGRLHFDYRREIVCQADLIHINVCLQERKFVDQQQSFYDRKLRQAMSEHHSRMVANELALLTQKQQLLRCKY
jgi:hypothetical protein